MKRLLLLGAALSLCVASSTAFALPTVGSINETTVLNALLSGSEAGPGTLGTFTGGATGGYQVPMADIQSGYSVAIDRSELEVARIPSIRVLAGITPDLEVGFGYEDIKVDLGAEATLSAWNFNAKYALPLQSDRVAVALGANYNKFEPSLLAPDFSTVNIYLAGTMPLPGDAKVTANITYTTADVDGDGINLSDNNDFTLALGYEKLFWYNNTVIGAELVLDGGEYLYDNVSSVNYANVYVNFPINDQVTGRVALSGIGEYTTTNIGLAFSL